MTFTERVRTAEVDREALTQAQAAGRCIGYARNEHRVAPCRRYEAWVTSELCRKCLTDNTGETKQKLFRTTIERRAARDALGPCTNRGAKTGVKKYGCCGGKKSFQAEQFNCTVHGNIDETKCWACKSYDSSTPTDSIDNRAGKTG